MAFIKQLEFENFTCKFGEKFTLLDLFSEIVWPAFQKRRFNRSYKGTDYFFEDTFLFEHRFKSGRTRLCLAGRFIKNTKLKRDQIYRPSQGIIEDPDELESAPSAIFVLILNNHRLIYVKEVSGAPQVKTFESVCLNFLKQSRIEFIDNLVAENKNKRVQNPEIKRLTKKSLFLKYPTPDLRITPLTDRRGLQDFINQFDKIETLSIKLLPTNKEEINNDDFWQEMDAKRESMQSDKVAVNFSNKKQGLQGDEVYNHCNSATTYGNSEIKLNGYGKHGNSLKGDNEDFHITHEAEELSRNLQTAAPSLVNNFYHLIKQKIIKLPKIPKEVVDKISVIMIQHLL